MSLTQYLKDNNLKNTKAVKQELAATVGFVDYNSSVEDNKLLLTLLTATKPTKMVIEPTGIIELYTKLGELANIKEEANKIVVADDQSDVAKGFIKTASGYLIKK